MQLSRSIGCNSVIPGASTPFVKNRQSSSPIDLSLLSHIINDAHAKETYKLQGYDPALTAAYLSQYIRHLPQDEQFADFTLLLQRMQNLMANVTRCKGIGNAEELGRYAEEIVDRLLAIEQQDQEIVLPGGWLNRADGGHGMLYIFKPTATGLDFYIYNDGAGLQYHPQYSSPQRELYSPVLVYHVAKPYKRAGLKMFIEQLLLVQLPAVQAETQAASCDEHRLYQEIMPRIADVNKQITRSTVTVTGKALRTGGQLSGTCAQAMLHQLLKEACPDDQHYQRLMYDFKCYALDDYLNHVTPEHLRIPGVHHQVAAAFTTLRRILLIPDLFTEAHIEQQRNLLQVWWSQHLPVIDSLGPMAQAIVPNSRALNAGLFQLRDCSWPPVIPTDDHTRQNNPIQHLQLSPKPAQFDKNGNLLLEIVRLLAECRALQDSQQYADVLDIVEQLFVQFPLPPAGRFSERLSFYDVITAENQYEFYQYIQELLARYQQAGRGIVRVASLPKSFVVHLLASSVLDYTQNRLAKWGNYTAPMLHHGVTFAANKMFAGLAKSSPKLATNDPSLDRRLKEIQTLYASEPAREPPTLAHKIAYYCSIIKSEPAIEQTLQARYSWNSDPEAQYINDFVRSFNCQAWYVYSTQLLEAAEEPLLRIFFNQCLLERTIFSPIIDWQRHLDDGSIIQFNQRSKALQIDIKKPRYAVPYDCNVKDSWFFAFHYVWDCDFSKYTVDSRVCAAALTSNPTYETTRESDNQIQLRPAATMADKALRAGVVAGRQLYQLRNARALQIKQTLHYFRVFLDKLAIPDYQCYLEANLFEPGLLLNDMRRNRTQVLALVDRFVQDGLNYHAMHAPCTAESIPFLRIAYLVYDYAVQLEPTAALDIMSPLVNRLSGLLQANSNHRMAITASLHHYRFFSIVGLLRADDRMLDLPTRQAYLEQAMLSYFYMNLCSNVESALDTASRVDLECRKHDFIRMIEQCVPQCLADSVQLVVRELCQEAEFWRELAHLQYAMFILTQEGARKCYVLDLRRGLIFNEKNAARMITPLDVEQAIRELYPMLKIPDLCFAKLDDEMYELGDTHTQLRYDKSEHCLHKQWTVNGQTQWYVLYSQEDMQRWTFHCNIPDVLKERDRYIWIATSTSKAFVITQNQRPIYHYDDQSQRLKQLDGDGFENGYALCPKGSWLKQIVAAFEAPEFVTVFRHRDATAHIELPRYGLTLRACQHGTSNSTVMGVSSGLISSAETWQYCLANQPSARLLLDEGLQAPRRLAMLPEVAALLFVDEISQQRYCFIAMQPFIARDKLAATSEFYHATQDTQAEKARAILDQGVEKEEISREQAKLWKYTDLETYKVFRLDEQGLPQAPNAEDALYLCYLYLGSHQPELAWQTLDYAAKRLGGLQGTAAEVAGLQLIIDELPLVLPDTGIKDAAFDTPPYVACQLKALAMLVRALSPEKRDIVFPGEIFDKHTADGFYNNAKRRQTKQFYDQLNEKIYERFRRYQSMQRDMLHNFCLSDEEQRHLLEYYIYNLPGPAPKAIGALGYAREALRLKMLMQEAAAIEACRGGDGQLPAAYAQRLSEIERVLIETKYVRAHDSEVVLKAIDLTLAPKVAAQVTANVAEITYDISIATCESELRDAMNCLHLDMGEASFTSHVTIYLKLLLTASDPLQRQKLVDFCYAYLLCHRHVQPDKQTQMHYLCNLLYRIDVWFGPFIKHLAFTFQPIYDLACLLKWAVCLGPQLLLSLLTWRWQSWEIETKCDLNRLLAIAASLPNPLIQVYELADRLGACMPISKETLAANILSVEPINSTNLLIDLQGYAFETLVSRCSIDQTEAKIYREQAARYGAAPSVAVDTFEAELQAGRQQAAALQAMKEQAAKMLCKHSVRTELLKQAQRLLADLKQRAEALQADALNLANSGYLEHASSPIREVYKDLLLSSGIRAQLSPAQLLVLYGQADRAQYRLATGLADAQIKSLHDMIGSWVAASNRQYALQRLVDNLPKLCDNSSVTEMQTVAHELLTQDLVDYSNEPQLAIFQYHEKVLLRPQQKAALSRLLRTTAADAYPDIVEKIIMGGGKSKVVLPAMAKGKANGRNLVVVEVPQGLLQTNYADLADTSGRLFDQGVFAFAFSRETRCTPESLEFLYERLTDVIVRKGYVVTTGDAVQSLELKYLELLSQRQPVTLNAHAIWEKQVAGVDKLVQLFRTRADAVLDEVHQALLLKKKLNYTLGDPQSIAPEVIKKTIELYDFFAKVPLGQPGQQTMHDLLLNNQLLTTDAAWQTVLQQLAQVLLSHADSPLRPELNQLGGLTDDEYCGLRDYLLNISTAGSKAIITRLTACDPKVRNLLARYKEQLSQLLPLTLRRNLNEHYGASHQDPIANIAIPYMANNVPSERSRFANHREAMNFTIQMVKKQGIPTEVLHNYLAKTQDVARSELVKMPWLRSIDDTPTGVAFNPLLPAGYTLSGIALENEATRHELFAACQPHQPLISRVLLDEILPKQAYIPEILSSNAHTHVEIYRSCQGLTGTPDSNTTWHPRLQFNAQLFPATNGFIIDRLVSKATEIRGIDMLASLDVLLRQMLDGRRDVHAIMDICAVFKGEPNVKIAYALAEYLQRSQSKLTYVMFFNADNQLCALNTAAGNKPIVLNSSDPEMIDRVLGCGPAQRFSYYDQDHTTGTDLKQCVSAKALAVIDPYTPLQSFLQGVMRMRDFANDQGIEVIVPASMQDYSLLQVVDMMRQNQEQQWKRDNFAATKAKMSNHLRAHVLQRILRCATVSEKQALFMQYKQLFVEQIGNETNFFERYGQLAESVSTEILLTQHRDFLLAINPEEFAALQPALDQMIATARPLCEPTYLSNAGGDAANEVELQNQLEMQQEQEQEQEQEQQLEPIGTEYIPTHYLPWLLSPGTQVYSKLNDFLSLTAICQSADRTAPTFGAIYASSNFYRTHWFQNNFLGPYCKPVHALLFRQAADGTLDCAILSQQEAHELTLKLRAYPEAHVWISNTAMDLLAGQPPAGIEQKRQYQDMIEQVRYFSGEFKSLNKGDIPLNWLHKDTEKKIQFFQQHVRNNRETHGGDSTSFTRTLAMQKRAFAYICEHPEYNYSDAEWRQTISKELSDDEAERHVFAEMLRVYGLTHITEWMCAQSSAHLSRFLSANLSQDAVLLQQVLASADQQTCTTVIANLASMPAADFSEEVQRVIADKSAGSWDWSFLLNCLGHLVQWTVDIWSVVPFMCNFLLQTGIDMIGKEATLELLQAMAAIVMMICAETAICAVEIALLTLSLWPLVAIPIVAGVAAVIEYHHGFFKPKNNPFQLAQDDIPPTNNETTQQSTSWLPSVQWPSLFA